VRALDAPVDERLREATKIYDWSVIAPQYDETLERLADSR